MAGQAVLHVGCYGNSRSRVVSNVWNFWTAFFQGLEHWLAEPTLHLPPRIFRFQALEVIALRLAFLFQSLEHKGSPKSDADAVLCNIT